MIYSQHLLDLNREIIVELFAGGSGAGTGIEKALGRPVDVAVNHDPAACAMYRLNHPHTQVLTADVFEVDPREVAKDRPVGVLWASPDCTYHSKARGAKPIRHRNRKRRALAWVLKHWTGTVRPRVVHLENVEEFAMWGPLVGPPDSLRPCVRRQGRTFRRWIKQTFTDRGYAVEWRERRACDAGAPTIRKRLFLTARCDGLPIVWPESTHGPRDSEAVKSGRLLPYRTAAECIDWSTPMLSIFATREEAIAWGRAHGQAPPVRPLAEATMRRIARGVMRYVVNNPKPFLVTLNHGGGREHAPRGLDEPFRTVAASRDVHAVVAPVVAGVGGRAGQSRERSGDEPFHTVTSKGDTAIIAPVLTECANGSSQRNMPADEPLRSQCAEVKGGHFALTAPLLVPRYGEREGQQPRTRSVEEPAPVVVPTGNGGSLAAVHLTSYHAEKREGDVRGAGADEPVDTIDTANRHAVVSAFLAQHNGGFYAGDGRALDGPAGTVCAEGSPQGLVAASLTRFNENASGAPADEPLGVAVAGAQAHGLVAAHVSHMQGGDPDGGDGSPAEPLRAVTSTSKASAVYAFLQKYYGTDQDPRIDEPLHTIPTKDRFGVVTVTIDGHPFVIADIAMRMLQPVELYEAQGFPIRRLRPGQNPFIYDRGLFPPDTTHKGKVLEWRADGWTVRALTKTEQVRMCGNSVSPEESCAIVGANRPDLIVRDEALPVAAPAVRAPRRRRVTLAHQPSLEPAGAA